MGICQKSFTITESKLDPLSRLRRNTSNDSEVLSLEDVYEVGETIGEGTFGVVRKGRRWDNPNITVAIKSISKSLLKQNMMSLKNEFRILSSIDHPNIVRLYDSFDSLNFFHIVTEFCAGGDLHKRILSGVNETRAASYMTKMLRAVNHLHEKGISHRDIKPHNFMFETAEEDSELKLIDFGMSKKYKNSQFSKVKMTSFVGTPSYIAPEVISASYNEKCDEWGLGVILYLMLTKTMPFKGSTNGDLYREIIRKDLDLKSREFKEVSESAKDLLVGLLNKDPSKRISSSEALLHPWIKQNSRQSSDKSVISRLVSYKSQKELYKITQKIHLKYMPSHELKILNDAFTELDSQGKGYFVFETFKKALRNSGLDLNEKEVADVFKRLDPDSTGVVHYSSFLVALSGSVLLDESKAASVFRFFDRHKTGAISSKDFKYFFKKTGVYYSDDKIKSFMSDVSDNGVITLSQFRNYFNTHS